MWLAVLAALAAFASDAVAQNNAWFGSVYQGYANNRMLYNQRAAVSSTLKRAQGQAGNAQGAPTDSSKRAPAAGKTAASAEPIPITAAQFEPATQTPIMPAKLAAAFFPRNRKLRPRKRTRCG